MAAKLKKKKSRLRLALQVMMIGGVSEDRACIINTNTTKNMATAIMTQFRMAKNGLTSRETMTMMMMITAVK